MDGKKYKWKVNYGISRSQLESIFTGKRYRLISDTESDNDN